MLKYLPTFYMENTTPDNSNIDSFSVQKIKYQRKPIPDFPGYEIDTDGNVWKKLTPNKATSNNYPSITAWKDRGGFRLRVHSLVLSTFVESRPEGMLACHNDGNPNNNRLENLRWDTPKNNSADRIKHGTDYRGGKAPWAKLTEKQVRVIKWALYYGAQQNHLFKGFKISRAEMSSIKRGERWAHVKI